MIKKNRKGRIKLPIFEYNWSKEVAKEEPNLNIIRNQIKTFMFVIQNKENFKIDDFQEEFKKFTKMIKAWASNKIRKRISR
ncbi:MAG: hypothetical protein ACTSPS_14220 [Promethearchaeota archaeon]